MSDNGTVLDNVGDADDAGNVNNVDNAGNVGDASRTDDVNPADGTGLVSLVGAGPGDPELLTLRGKRRIEEADVIVYDRLVNPELLEFARDDAERIDVGKSAHHHPVKQREINDMLARLALEGKRVVRLKSGDPFVFGRGGEEQKYLRDRGVRVEIVPGITSAIAGPAAVGIPVTHRDYASSFHVIAGHRKREGHELDWDNIAHMEGTLVFLMGMESLDRITGNLIANGKPADTPIAVIQWATREQQRAVRSDLAGIRAAVDEAGLGAPALIVVGGVASLLEP
ncbi:uroporphyrinogen-III C-methyltransferase [Bifidobacterium callimiconis]|uniref:uroporphyrinogen-III C-methyltransferase n=1 Tax=Bifidobacterium callimiconis TaxID=2306973 RepID=A0A430FB66_9BIFI|nr:uroporphyrinogen-III C-methyltransferase [Bifidobacterium callimiconis]RSX50076.1 uroporphyrinogen-III C-methyltransferase [Bifidobacterium callimiconis]